MALIEKFVVVSTQFPVNASAELVEGMFVKLNSSGEIVVCTGASGEIALGVCADTKSTSVSGLPSTNVAYLGSNGAATSSFTNRISDQYDETKGSGKMTVYFSGGEFQSNQYTSRSYTVGEALYIASTGKLDNVASTSGQIVGTVLKAPGATDSGVPGLDVNGSMTLGNYIQFKLNI